VRVPEGNGCLKDSHVDASEAAPASASVALSLLLRLKTQDPEAWRRLLALYGPVFEEWCRRAGLQAEDVTDVAQEVFQAVARNLAHFRRERPGDTVRGCLPSSN